MKVALLQLLPSVLCYFFMIFNTGTVSLTVQNIQEPTGSIILAVYDSEEIFLHDGKAVLTLSKEVTKSAELTFTLNDLPYGNYAIAIYHDVNNNGKLDTNPFGVPKEPYGFSNNARSKWGPPQYDVAHFKLNQPSIEQQIAVKKWSAQ